MRSKEGKTMEERDKHGALSRVARDACTGGEEAHVAHLNMNGECPWCGAYTDALARRIKLPSWYVGCEY
jgi:hypothetical protein